MKKIFNLASFPARYLSLKQTIESILPQADEIHLYLNEYKAIPDFLADNPKIFTYLGEDHFGDLGDVGKFFNCERWPSDAFIFTCDDDIIYPPDYAEKNIAAIEKYGRKAVVSSHGRTFRKAHDIQDYYRDLVAYHGFPQLVTHDAFVHQLGTGVMAFHSSTVRVNLSVFTHTNDCDTLFCAYLISKGIPRVVMAHERLWLNPIHNASETSISGYFIKNPEAKTKVANRVPWEVHTCPVLS